MQTCIVDNNHNKCISVKIYNVQIFSNPLHSIAHYVHEQNNTKVLMIREKGAWEIRVSLIMLAI